MIWLLGVAVWVLCGVLSYGFGFAYFQREYPRLADMDIIKDRSGALSTCWAGPIALAVDLSMGHYRHGLLFHRKPGGPL